jgi:predicted amidophosphoribosyltransferase
VRGAPRMDKACPNCGAPLNVNMAGRCEHCDAKITSGEFDWVLSRIEQDEAYEG